MNIVHTKDLRKKSAFKNKVHDKIISFLNKNISTCELEIEVAIEEILNDLIKKNPKVNIRNIKIFKEHDDMGPYYKVKLITKLNDKNN